MKTYQTLVGLIIVSISILLSAHIVTMEKTEETFELNKQETELVKVEARFPKSDFEKRLRVFEQATGKSVSRMDEKELTPKGIENERETLSIVVYNGNEEISLTNVRLKITVGKNDMIYNVPMSVPPLQCHKENIRCFDNPSSKLCDYKVKVIAIEGTR